MRPRMIMVLAGVLLIGLALLAAGCGGKKKPAPPNRAALGLTAKTCRELIDLPVFFTDVMTGAGTNLNGTAMLLRRFARTSPLGIRADFAVLARLSTTIATTLKGVNLASGQTPTAKDVVKLKKLQTQVDTNSLTQS